MNSRLAVLVIFFLVLFYGRGYSQATWKGSISSSWSDPNNWSTLAVPNSSTDVIFDNGGLIDCVIDANASCKTLTVNSTYTKIITQSLNFALTVGTAGVTGNFAIFNGGTFNGGNKDITINGTFTLGGCSFTSTSANLKVGDNVTLSSGTFNHNNGTIAFNHTLLTKDIVFTDNLGVTLYDVTNAGSFSKTLTFATPSASLGQYNILHNLAISAFTGTHTINIASSSFPVTVAGIISLKGNQPLFLNGNAINAQGDVAITNTGAGGGGTATINFNGTGTQTLSSTNSSINLGNLPNVNINKTTGALNFSGFITCAGSSWTYQSGTIVPGTSTIGFYGTPLTISGSHSLNNVVLYGSYSTFTISNDLTANDVLLDATLRCDITISSSLTCNGTLTYSGSGYVQLNTGIVNVKGNVVNGNTNTAIGGGTASFIINGISNQTITGTPSADQGAYPPFTINKASGILSLSNYLTFYNGFTWQAGSVASGNSTCIFYDVLGAAQTVSPGSVQFNNIIFKQADYHPTSITGDLNVAGSFTINSASGVNMNNHNLYLGGNFTNLNLTASGGNYAFNIGTGMVTLNGSSQQVITTNNSSGSANLPVFYDLVINNTGASVTSDDIVLADILRVSHSASFTAGVLSTSASAYLYLLNGASSNIGNSASYINGPMSYDMAFNGARNLNFPIGDGSNWRYVILSLNHNSVSSFTYFVQVIHSSPAALSYTLPSTVQSVSSVRYINVDRSLTGGASSNASLNGNQIITFYYGADDSVVDYTQSTIVQTTGSGSPWIDIGGNATANTTGTITSTSSPSAFSVFGNKFSLATKSIPLGISLKDFRAELQTGLVNLRWTTLSEINNDQFIIERSSDGQTFEGIGKVKGQGTTERATDYQFKDEDPIEKLSYYRLKQIDFDGQYTISNVITAYLKDVPFSIFPNPVQNRRIAIGSIAVGSLVQIVALSGKCVYTNMVRDHSEDSVIVLPDTLGSGIFILIIHTGDKRYYSRIAVY